MIVQPPTSRHARTIIREAAGRTIHGLLPISYNNLSFLATYATSLCFLLTTDEKGGNAVIMPGVKDAKFSNEPPVVPPTSGPQDDARSGV